MADHAHRRGFGRAFGATVALLSAGAAALGCGTADEISLSDQIPSDLAFPVAVVHLYAEGGGPLFLAEDRDELDSFSLFVRSGDEVFFVEVAPTQFMTGCTAYELSVFCRADCFDVESEQRIFSVREENLEPSPLRTGELKEKLKCGSSQEPTCASCF